MRPMTGSQRIPTVLGDVAVAVRGDGPALLLWPSLLMSGGLWHAQVEHFSPSYRTIAVDPPGHGDSAPLRAGFTFEDCVLVIEQLLDALGVDRVHLVGNSWGAMLGVTFAALRPGRTASAVLMNGTASPPPLRQKLEYAVLTRAAMVRGGLRPPLTDNVVAAFLGPTSVRDRPAAVAHVRRTAMAVDVRSVRWAVTSVVPNRPDQRPLLGAISAPVTVVAGREDAVFPVADSEVMAAGITGARLVVVEDGAHLVALEVPDRVNALLEEHLARVSGSSKPAA